MILIDSVYVNDGGGLALLKYIVEVLNKTDLKVFYLFDERTKTIFNDLGLNAEFIANSLVKRKAFYEKNQDNFQKVFCFGNVPPPIKVKSTVITYFHQLLFLNIPENFSYKNKLVYRIKQLVLRFYKKNTDIWLTQSTLIQQSLGNKYFSGQLKHIKVLPFYPPFDFASVHVERIGKTFLYVSNSAPHKNHHNLIQAFCNAYDQTQQGCLILTVPECAEELNALIKEKKSEGYPIDNVGFVDRGELTRLYLENEYLIFPSLAESFGLGLAEAIDGGCKVIASELPYTYQVCNPSLTFNPYIIEEIEIAIITAVTENLPSSEKVISNDISQLISLLSE